MRQYRGLFLASFLLASCGCGSASVSEIRKNFFNRTKNLPATAIMSAPKGDASYLISAYESTTSCTIVPELRWTDENAVARSQVGTVVSEGGSCYASLLANIRVHAQTRPTVETSGADSGFHYSLYVSGLGFWPAAPQRQAGLSEATGSLPNQDLIYALPIYEPPASTNALLIAYSTGYAGKDIPYANWTDEYGNNSVSIPVGTSALVPVRMGETRVWIHTFPGDTTWYALIVFGAPAKGTGPFGDYEVNLLNWSNATYPNWQALFTAGNAGANVLILSDVTQPANSGTVGKGYRFTGQIRLQFPVPRL